MLSGPRGWVRDAVEDDGAGRAQLLLMRLAKGSPSEEGAFEARPQAGAEASRGSVLGTSIPGRGDSIKAPLRLKE